jgi:hypothetical protein
MMNDTLKSFLSGLAPTLASALGGPLFGVAVAGLTKILGIDGGTVADVTKAISDGRVTPEQVAEIRKLEMQFQSDEKERGFRYAELEFKDRDSARNANVHGGIQAHMFWLSVTLLVLTLGTEIYILFNGYPNTLPDIIVGRILGLLDGVALLVLGYHYGTTSNSMQKSAMLAQSTPK